MLVVVVVVVLVVVVAVLVVADTAVVLEAVAPIEDNHIESDHNRTTKHIHCNQIIQLQASVRSRASTHLTIWIPSMLHTLGRMKMLVATMTLSMKSC